MICTVASPLCRAASDAVTSVLNSPLVACALWLWVRGRPAGPYMRDSDVRNGNGRLGSRDLSWLSRRPGPRNRPMRVCHTRAKLRQGGVQGRTPCRRQVGLVVEHLCLARNPPAGKTRRLSVCVCGGLLVAVRRQAAPSPCGTRARRHQAMGEANQVKSSKVNSSHQRGGARHSRPGRLRLSSITV